MASAKSHSRRPIGAVIVAVAAAVLSLGAVQTVPAHAGLFWAQSYVLTISNGSTGGGGAGTITSNIGPISCGATCAGRYQNGAAITLTETPTGTSLFAGWSGGGCAGTGSTCTVTLRSATTVSASFCKFNATGGSIGTAGGYTIHTFASGGTFATGCTSSTVEYLIVAAGGGAAAGQNYGGGGGGGGVVVSSGTASGSYAVVVGTGATGATGGASSVFGLTANGGGAGGTNASNGSNGGSGGGGGGNANTSGGTASQGHNGGTGVDNGFNPGHGAGAGGGGWGATGDTGTVNAGGCVFGCGGAGGAGSSNAITTVATTYAGGGGGCGDASSGGGGGGGGGNANGLGGANGTDGLGGGGGCNNSRGGNGVVIIRYVTP